MPLPRCSSAPLRRALDPLSIAGALRSLSIVPVRKAGPRLVAEWLAELSDVYGGDRPSADLLRPDWLARFGSNDAASSLSELLNWRYRDVLSVAVGPELMHEPVYRRLLMHEAREAV